MAISEAIYSLVTGTAGVAALIGDRLYPGRQPDAPAAGATTYPCITYDRLSAKREYSHGGDSRLPHPRFQFSVWDPEYSAARAAATALIEAISGYRGTVGGVVIQAVFVENDQETFEPEAKLHRVLVDAVVWHKD